MEEKILDIINQYTINDKFIDVSAVEKIVEIVTNEHNLREYVKHLSFDNENIGRNFYALGKYNFCNREIVIYLKRIEEYLNENPKYLNNNFEKLLYKNLECLKIIMHEIKHADQIKFQERKKKILLKELLDFCDMTALINDKTYELAWEFDPKERDAENFANAYIIRLQTTHYPSFKTLNFILNLKLNRSLFCGYNNQNTRIYPFIKYLNINYKDVSALCEWFNEEEFGKIEAKDRFNYGLKLSNKEYEQMLSMKK